MPTTFQVHLGAYNALKHLKSLYVPYESDIWTRYDPPWCGNDDSDDSDGPSLEEKLEKQRKEVLKDLMHGISTEVVKREGSTLCEVAVGVRRGYSQTVWERGANGELYESKEVKFCKRTGRVISVTRLHCPEKGVSSPVHGQSTL